MTDIKKDVQEKEIVIGTERTIRGMKNGNISKVYVALNCPNEIKEDVMHYGKIGKIEVINLKENNEELGIICKKPFPISVLGVRV